MTSQSQPVAGSVPLPVTEAAPSAEAKFTLELGAFATPFDEQLSRQGLPFNPDLIAHLWLDAMAASRLKIRGVIGYAAGERLYDKIAKSVWREVHRAIKAARNKDASAANADTSDGEVSPGRTPK